MDQANIVIDINASELKKRIDAQENLLIIDVREKYEYDEFNIGARLIPLGDLQSQLPVLKEYLDREVIIHCRSGARSAAAKVFMLQNGFKNVRSLEGGIVAYQDLLLNT